jgi:hypothetical protein
MVSEISVHGHLAPLLLGPCMARQSIRMAGTCNRTKWFTLWQTGGREWQSVQEQEISLKGMSTVTYFPHPPIAHSAMNSSMAWSIREVSALKIQSSLNSATIWGPSPEHMNLLGDISYPNYNSHHLRSWGDFRNGGLQSRVSVQT